MPANLQHAGADTGLNDRERERGQCYSGQGPGQSWQQSERGQTQVGYHKRHSSCVSGMVHGQQVGWSQVDASETVVCSRGRNDLN